MDKIVNILLIFMILYFINEQFFHAGKTTDSISNVKMFPESPATLAFHRLNTGAVKPLSRVDLSFEYTIMDNEGAYIFTMPYGNTHKIIFKASPLYPKGSGKISTYFSLTEEGKVNRVKLYIMDKTRKNELYAIFIPVNYTFSQ